MCLRGGASRRDDDGDDRSIDENAADGDEARRALAGRKNDLSTPVVSGDNDRRTTAPQDDCASLSDPNRYHHHVSGDIHGDRTLGGDRGRSPTQPE